MKNYEEKPFEEVKVGETFMVKSCFNAMKTAIKIEPVPTEIHGITVTLNAKVVNTGKLITEYHSLKVIIINN